MKNKKTFYLISTIGFFVLAFFFTFLLLQKGSPGEKLGMVEGVFTFCENEIEQFGETYRVVKVGDRCWMSQNLRTTKYSNGTEILRINEDKDWEQTTQGAFSVYPNTEVFVKDDTVEGGCGIATDIPGEEGGEGESKELMEEDEVVRKFGYLYNYHAINSAFGLCPEGWSLPTHDDWTTLERALCTSSTCEFDFPFDEKTIGERGTNEGSKIAGFIYLWRDGELKEDSAFDASSFDALPGGFRDSTGFFGGQSISAHFWSAPDADGGTWVREIHNNKTSILRQYFQAFFGGMSVRCIKDK